MTFQYEEYEGFLSEDVLKGIESVYKEVFNTADCHRFYEKYHKILELHTQIARFKGDIIGFKMGYPLNETVFYSWLGGVKEDFRGRGIASQLIIMQFESCKKRGFKTIQTKTMNRWRNMLILNIKNGFDVVSIYVDKNGETKIVLEKTLF